MVVKKCLWAGTLFGLLWLGVRILFPLVSPFVFGALLALGAEPVVRFLQRYARIPRSVSAGIGVSMVFFLLGLGLLALCSLVLRELKSLAQVLPELEQTARSGFSMTRQWLLELTARTPQTLAPLLRQNVESLFSDGAALLDKVAGYLLGAAGSLIGHIPDSALGLGTTLLAAFMISAKLPQLHRRGKEILAGRYLAPVSAGLRQFRCAAGGWLAAQCKLMGLTFVILCLGLVLLRVPYALLWAAGIALVDAFPVLGTGTVLIPWSLFCFLGRDVPRGIGLAGIYITIALSRSMLEPKLLGRHLGLDPLLTLLALYAGYKLWGVAGMLLAPMAAAAALQITPQSPPEEEAKPRPGKFP